MITWITIWIILWATVMGLPNYLYKKYKITYFQNWWQHTLFFISFLAILFVVYQNQYSVYFNNFSSNNLLIILGLLLVYYFLLFIFLLYFCFLKNLQYFLLLLRF